jgi:hypothetical protein
MRQGKGGCALRFAEMPYKGEDQRFCNQQVIGSSPIAGSIHKCCPVNELWLVELLELGG